MAAAAIEITEPVPTEPVFPNAETEALFEAAENGNADEVLRLIRAGADSRFQEEVHGRSALMLAAHGGHLAAVDALLLDGAPWNAVDRMGKCAGDYALRGGFQDVVDRLVSAGVQAELLFRALAVAAGTPSDHGGSAYLTTSVRYTNGDLLDADNRGVMMEWERPIMEAHADVLCASHGDVLNIGFGLGIIDTAIQARGPRSHTIVEAHPDVLAKMEADGWHLKPNVRIVRGRWQDVLETLGDFDAVFFDTFDDVGGMEEFHVVLPRLVRPGGLYSFFNGITPESVFFQGVACEVIAMQLADMGFSLEFGLMEVPRVTDPETWRDTAFRYYLSDNYYLPVAIRSGASIADDAAE